MTPDEVVISKVIEVLEKKIYFIYNIKLSEGEKIDLLDEELGKVLSTAITLLQDYQKLREKLTVEKITKIMIEGLTEFTKKPIGTLEGDLCDWNKPTQFACKPIDIQNRVKERLGDISQAIVTYLQQPTEH